MKITQNLKTLSFIALLLGGIIFLGCNDEDDKFPDEENEEEVITDITLRFTNEANSNDVVEATAQDMDGAGVGELQILNEINLDLSKTYILTFEIKSTMNTPHEDIGNEISEEGEDHQLFFSFSNDAFAKPTGNGNLDKSTDPLNYNDFDEGKNPIGLQTSWTTSSKQLKGGKFTVRLQHQPDIKSATTGANDGDTDFELEFVLNIQ